MDNTKAVISHIELNKWRQFNSIYINFHPRLTILTGANGSGKSTILSILEAKLVGGQPDQYLATPEEDKQTKRTVFSISSLFSSLRKAIKGEAEGNQPPIGKIKFEDGSEAVTISYPPPNQIQYQLQFSDHKQVDGFKISSHRPIPKYQRVSDIPVGGISPKDAFEFYRQSATSYEAGNMIRRGANQITNPLSPLKQTLISFALHGSSNEDVTAVPELQGLFRDFQNTLRRVLPKEIKFKKLNVRSAEVIVETDTGDFPIDGASGGLMSLIQTSWQIFLYSKSVSGRSVVLIDEPENHLHPSLQREFLARLVEAFPDVQYVVATHSPFIIGSVKDSSIYALWHETIANEDGDVSKKAAVKSRPVGFEKSVGTASSVLNEILGVSVTMPIWAEDELAAIVDSFQKEEIDEVAMRKLRFDLAEAGLSDFFPQAINRLLK
ncbi:AAA family ATPase [Ruegeria arenilitoris]|uniref:AAA family ATPase n=1 Tax=Ruegeria arenilitoris TaxID=1173585 RepID=UPI0014807D0B|nr:AAA family ATPase [Ruegeria arenilitoris]